MIGPSPIDAAAKTAASFLASAGIVLGAAVIACAGLGLLVAGAWGHLANAFGPADASLIAGLALVAFGALVFALRRVPRRLAMRRRPPPPADAALWLMLAQTFQHSFQAGRSFLRK